MRECSVEIDDSRRRLDIALAEGTTQGQSRDCVGFDVASRSKSVEMRLQPAKVDGGLCGGHDRSGGEANDRLEAHVQQWRIKARWRLTCGLEQQVAAHGRLGVAERPA